MSKARRIYLPCSAQVEVGVGGAPVVLGAVSVEDIREELVVEDRWWTERALQRHYFELVLAGGRIATVYRDMRTDRWHRQAA